MKRLLLEVIRHRNKGCKSKQLIEDAETGNMVCKDCGFRLSPEEIKKLEKRFNANIPN